MPTARDHRVILIFGLAGSGKSTLARRLGETYGLRVIHPSGIMRDLMEGRGLDLGATRQNDGFWETEDGARLLSDRLSHPEPVDMEANRILLAEVEKGDLVMDTWALPWLTSVGTRIHLQAELDVRARRAALRGGLQYEDARTAIAKKDQDTRGLFRRLYGFDIMRDRHVFDVTLDTSDLNAEQVWARVVEALLPLGWSTPP